jgi:lipopolysaccharide biosynthesis regulator YciM
MLMLAAAADTIRMSLQEIVVMIHEGEYGRAIASLEFVVKDESRPPQTRVECCRWLAECNHRLEEYKEAGDWYIEAVRIVLRTDADNRSKAKQALPLCGKALEAYEKGGDPADVLVAARVKQYLVGLDR